MSISNTLNDVANLINKLNDTACLEVRKFLVQIGMKKKYTELYTVNFTGGGEWVLDTLDRNYGLASCDIIIDDNLTLDDIRTLARHELTSEQLAEIGL